MKINIFVGFQTFFLFVKSLSIEDSERLLAKVDGEVFWVWNPELICELQTPSGYSFQTSYIKKRYVTLKGANCTKIRMEVLQCEYDFIGSEFYVWSRSFYASGLNGELFLMGPPIGEWACDGPKTLIIYFNIFEDDLPIFKHFEYFRNQKNEKSLKKKRIASAEEANKRIEIES